MKIWALVLVGSIALSAQRTYGGQAPISVEMSLDAPRISLHEPVLLNVSVTNKRTEPVQIDLGSDRKERFKISITSPSGSTIQLPQLRKSGLHDSGNVSIQAGEKYSQTLVLNEWYDFSEIGVYLLEVELSGPALQNEAVEGGGDKSRLTLEIDARDQDALAKRCEGLVAAIEASTSYEISAQKAQALSYVNDPIAVAYLLRALKANKLVEPIAIKGLERIATPEAVAALSPALRMNRDHTSDLAKAALSRIEYKTTDPAVKQEIQRIRGESASPAS